MAGVRTRVLVSFVALLVLSTAASVLVLRQVLLSRIGVEVEKELREEVDALRAQSQAGAGGQGVPFAHVGDVFDAFLRRNSPPAGVGFVTYVGGDLYRAEAAGSQAFTVPESVSELAATADEPRSGELETPAGDARYVAVPVTAGDGSGTFVALGDLDDEREQVESAVWIAIGVSAVVLLLAALFIWLAAGRAVAPLQALARTARAISETDLSRRIPARGGDEIAALGRTFNRMLDRLEAAFAGQKEFLTDVSHELRTPITVIRGHLETLGESPAERDEAIAVIQDELDRMNRFVDDLLLLARAPRPDFLRVRPIDLDLFTHDLFAKAHSLGERDWKLDETGVGILVADQQRLTQAVMNLATNAVRHTREGERIWIGSSIVDGSARLWVRDEGPGVAPEDRDRIFERFSQASRSPVVPNSDGAGLGLAIVRAIAEAHGGTVELESRVGSGATFTVVVPAGLASSGR